MEISSRDGIKNFVFFLELLHIPPHVAFSEPTKRINWFNFIANAEIGLDSLHFIYIETSQRTQILFCYHIPRVSLVLAAAKSIKRSLEKFDRNIKDLAQQCNKTALYEVYKVSCFWFFGQGTKEIVEYIGAKYTNFYVFRVVEFRYYQTYKRMPFA